MARGLSAAKIIVIHTRKIVVDERIRLDALKSASKRNRSFTRTSEDSAEFKHKKRTDALSATQSGVSHCIRNNGISRKLLGEVIFEFVFNRKSGILKFSLY
jgi:hypothetical protein